MAERARRLAQHGVDLSAAGQREAALEATRESVELHRALAARNPDAFHPDLATSLNNLGFRLSDLGQHEEALAARREAEQLRPKTRSGNSSADHAVAPGDAPPG